MNSSNSDDELSIATPDDFLVQRDEENNLQPVTQALPGVEESVRIVPMTMGDLNKYGGANGQLNPAELSNEDIAEIINNHWFDLRESERELDADSLEDELIGFGPEPLVQAILRASGYDLQQGLNMENLEMLEKVPEGKLDVLTELAERQS